MDAINDPATALLAGAAAHVVGDYVLGAAIALHRDDAHHLGKARRLTEGERATVSPGDGSVRSYLIDSVGREAIELRVDSATAHELEPRPLALAFAPPKGDRWELILRAGTELGVTDFIPLETDRGIAKWHGRSSARGAKIILEAMNQSRRCWRPRVSAPQQLRDWIESETEGQILLADTPHHSECADRGRCSQRCCRDRPRRRIFRIGTGIHRVAAVSGRGNRSCANRDRRGRGGFGDVGCAAIRFEVAGSWSRKQSEWYDLSRWAALTNEAEWL